MLSILTVAVWVLLKEDFLRHIRKINDPGAGPILTPGPLFE
jgi:hypothetical protein